MATPTGKLIRNPQVLNAMGMSTIAAPSQQAVTTAVADAKKAGTDAQSTANTANSTANAAKTAAATADGKAVAAQTAADTAKAAAATADGKAVAAQTAANNANNNANGRVPTSRKINGMDLTADRNITASQVGAYSKTESDARYQLKGQASGVTLGDLEEWLSKWSPAGSGLVPGLAYAHGGAGSQAAGYTPRFILPSNVVMCNQGSQGQGSGAQYQERIIIQYRRITGGI